jgi:hypothetical protein
MYRLLVDDVDVVDVDVDAAAAAAALPPPPPPPCPTRRLLLLLLLLLGVAPDTEFRPRTVKGVVGDDGDDENDDARGFDVLRNSDLDCC